MRFANFIMIITMFTIFGCGKNNIKESKNMEQLHRENGIPVKTNSLSKQNFELSFPFTSALTGLKQSFASAMIDGRIEKINVKVGDYVEKDQVIMEFPEDAPNSQYAQAKSAYELAHSTYSKMKNVYDAGGIAKIELDQIKTQYEVSKANFDAISQMLKVRAPISGYVTNITVKETDQVKVETILATISQTKQLKAKVWVTENEIFLVKKGQYAKATWNGLTIEGEVTEVGLAIDPSQNAFGVDIVFDNKNNEIRSGVITDVELIVYKNDFAIVVDRKSIQKDNRGNYVYTINNGNAQKTYVQTGLNNDYFEILDGLEEGDKVITTSLNLVYDGAKVRES